MITTYDVYNYLNKIYPYNLAEKYDNSGIIYANDKPVKKILIALDITSVVIDEALEKGFDLIVSHHPVIYPQIRSIDINTFSGIIVKKLIKNDISAICAHTNLDIAKNGVNDVLANELKIKDIKNFIDDEGNAIGRTGITDIENIENLCDYIKNTLNATQIKYISCNKKISPVAVISGSGGSYASQVKNSGANTLITGDCKHSAFLEAAEINLNLIDATHFSTENLICEKLCEVLANKFSELIVETSKNSKNIVKVR